MRQLNWDIFSSHFSGNKPRQFDFQVQRPNIELSIINPLNVLAIKKPLVSMDEAHNARTKLTFATLQRIHP